MIEGMPTVEAAEFTIARAYGIYMDGEPNAEMVIELAKFLPRKVTLPCGNFRWFSDVHYDMLDDISCNCGAPYEHYFIKWGKRAT